MPLVLGVIRVVSEASQSVIRIQKEAKKIARRLKLVKETFKAEGAS